MFHAYLVPGAEKLGTACLSLKISSTEAQAQPDMHGTSQSHVGYLEFEPCSGSRMQWLPDSY